MEEIGYSQGSDEFTLRLRDLEDKQNLIKDRTILLGKNLIETKETLQEKVQELKKEIEIIKTNINKLISIIETISSEIPRFAKKEDLEIVYKQTKMLKPLLEEK